MEKEKGATIALSPLNIANFHRYCKESLNGEVRVEKDAKCDIEENSAEAAAQLRAKQQAQREEVYLWRARKAAEMEAKSKVVDVDSAENQAKLALRRQEQRVRQEKVALYKLEKEQRERYEEEVKQLLKGPTPQPDMAQMRERLRADLEGARQKREAVLSAAAAVRARPQLLERHKRNLKVERNFERLTKDTDSSSVSLLCSFLFVFNSQCLCVC